MRYLISICLFIGLALSVFVTVGAAQGVFSLLQAGFAVCFWAICTIFTICNENSRRF